MGISMEETENIKASFLIHNLVSPTSLWPSALCTELWNLTETRLAGLFRALGISLQNQKFGVQFLTVSPGKRTSLRGLGQAA